MGIKYSSSDSSNLIQAINNNANLANQVTDRLASGANHLIGSLDSGELQGAAYTAGKGLFSEIIIPAIQKLQLAIDDIQSEISSYQYADSIVSEYGTLDMDSLKKQLKLRRQQLNEIEKQLKSNQDFFKQAQAFVTGNLGNLLAQNSALYQLQDAVIMRIDDTQERIDKLEWFVADVSKYFSDSLQVLQLAIKGATELNKVTVDSDGNYYTNGADMSWLTQMKNTNIDTQIHGNKPSTDQTLEDAVAHLGLTPDALAY